jgi:hypothetical protein
MPFPDQVRDDRSGIQNYNTLKKNWIPGQARNDKLERRQKMSLLIVDESKYKRGGSCVRDAPGPLSASKAKKAKYFRLPQRKPPKTAWR